MKVITWPFNMQTLILFYFKVWSSLYLKYSYVTGSESKCVLPFQNRDLSSWNLINLFKSASKSSCYVNVASLERERERARNRGLRELSEWEKERETIKPGSEATFEKWFRASSLTSGQENMLSHSWSEEVKDRGRYLGRLVFHRCLDYRQSLAIHFPGHLKLINIL